MLVETYANQHTSPPGYLTRRYTVHPEVMVGGEINDADDLRNLRRARGVFGVLNVGGRSEEHMMPVDRCLHELCEIPLVDNGEGFDRDAVRQALSFAMHCHIGVSRSPAIAYGVLRWVYGMSATHATLALDGSGGEFGYSYEHYAPKHRVYLASVDRALGG